MRSPPISRTKQAGFTLLEISIVLVIVGLTIGGIIVGRDMIEQAKLRAQISQIEQFQIVVKTFKMKYNCLPGDCLAGLNFGFTRSGGGGQVGRGDGNDRIVIQKGSGTFFGTCTGTFSGEGVLFWRDLSEAQLISDTFNTTTGANPLTNPVIGAEVSLYLPRAKIGNGGYVHVWSGGWGGRLYCPWSDGNNYFSVTKAQGATGAGQFQIMSQPVFTVLQAWAIDSKLDDGLPQFGRVIAHDGGFNGWSSNKATLSTASGITFVNDPAGAYDSTGGPVTSASSPAVSTPATSYTCYDNGNVPNATEQYSIGTNGGSGVNCNLTFQFQ